jgi:hypothetical protein
MSEIVVESLNQKFELHSYKVFFDINDSLIAEEMLDSLDRASANFKQFFNMTEDPAASFYLLRSEADVEKATGTPAKMGESIRIVFEQNAVLFILPRLNGNYGELAVRELGHLYFNNKVAEKEVRIRQFRTPSWLREGIALQSAFKVRKDNREFLQAGWAKLQDAQKSKQLIKPDLMLKDINLIPNPQRRELAQFQAFYMVRLLLTIYCDSFFNKYSTLMGALTDMEAEACFRQITSFDFNKFFDLFDNWVEKTNAWAAME